VQPVNQNLSEPDSNIHAAIVDDDASLCKALSRLLNAAGISSTIYSSAEAFLTDALIREPDCLILDIQLGGMSGVELQRSLHATHRYIPIIFITAHDQPEAREEAVRGGCLAYLRKNDPGNMLLAAVRSVVGTGAGAQNAARAAAVERVV